MFKVGDIVEITEESSATGMLDFADGKGYAIRGVGFSRAGLMYIKLVDESGRWYWYTASHFKLKEEAKMGEKECLFKKGQAVWDVIYGEGKVLRIGVYGDTVVEVGFYEDGNLMFTRDFTADGKVHRNVKRSLYFSESKIEAATEPLFESTLKEGDVVVISGFNDRTASEDFKIGVVEEETEEFVYTTGNDPWDKGSRDFYRLGEKINFK